MSEKRKAGDSDNEEEWIGPLPSEAAPAKKQKGLCLRLSHCYLNLFHLLINYFHSVLEYEKVYLENLPNCEIYEKSYMHRDMVTHIAITKYVLYKLTIRITKLLKNFINLNLCYFAEQIF